MRTLLFSILASALFMVLPGRQASAQTTAQIVADTWNGYSEFEADFLQGGVGSITQTLTINVYSDNGISGKMKSVIDLNGTIYVCYSSISGRVYEADSEVYLTATINSGADVLPHGLEWCGVKGTLTLYNDSNRSGYYVLKGNATDDCSGANVALAFSNY